MIWFWRMLGLSLCVGIAIIPETIMYLVYHAIQPGSDIARVILLAAFWIVGSGVCVGFAALGIYLALTIVVATSTQRQLR